MSGMNTALILKWPVNGRYCKVDVSGLAAMSRERAVSLGVDMHLVSCCNLICGLTEGFMIVLYTAKSNYIDSCWHTSCYMLEWNRKNVNKIICKMWYESNFPALCLGHQSYIVSWRVIHISISALQSSKELCKLPVKFRINNREQALTCFGLGALPFSFPCGYYDGSVSLRATSSVLSWI